MSTELSIFNPQVWQTMCNQANVLVKSGFLPSSIKNAEQAIAIMMKGHEVGFPPMQAFSHINIIQGKPCTSAEAQLALIYKNCPGAKINFIKLDNTGCEIEASRPNGKPTIFKFEQEDAKLAGLLNKDNWKKFPRAMYRSRAVSEMARSMFPDSIMGLSYTPEEINPDFEVDDNGQTIVIDSEVKNKALEKSKDVEPIQIYDMNDTESRKWLVRNARIIKTDITNESIADINKKLHGTPMEDAPDMLQSLLTLDNIF